MVYFRFFGHNTYDICVFYFDYCANHISTSMVRVVLVMYHGGSSLSSKKIKFFCIVDDTEINEIPLFETVLCKVDGMVYFLPELDFPPIQTPRIIGGFPHSIAKPRFIVFYEVYIHFALQLL